VLHQRDQTVRTAENISALPQFNRSTSHPVSSQPVVLGA